MDSKFIKPNLFTADPSSSQASKEWIYWFRTLKNFLESFPAELPITDESKLRCLMAHVDKNVYELISECEDYLEAIQTLDRLYVKPLNIIFARDLLMTCKQEPGQSVDDYLQKLKRLTKDCGYRAVDAETHKHEAVRDAFISGLTSSSTRLRLLENIQDAAITFEACTLEVAQRNSEVYNSSQSAINSQGLCLSTVIPLVKKTKSQFLTETQLVQRQNELKSPVPFADLMNFIRGLSVLLGGASVTNVDILVILVKNAGQVTVKIFDNTSAALDNGNFATALDNGNF
ncbi:Hypothetical predicted protein [Octopus vulgaris]|uniref:Retrotransposon gag domain-containing protein n=1 Tax=Octopus vulgaris TaxID=6645 RepID=A0AA36AYJ5_OCTVU|nr:Hypothetical predicted protein [Octopus vulgaris]